MIGLGITQVGLIGFVAILVFLMVRLDDRQVRYNGVKIMKANTKILIVAWFGNLMLFTSLLWGGSYMMNEGVKWIEVPLATTLTSLGLAKVAMTYMLACCLFHKEG